MTYQKKITVLNGFIYFILILIQFFILNRMDLKNLSYAVIARNLVSLISVICGIFCAFFYTDNGKTKLIIYFLYSMGFAFSLYFFGEINPNYNNTYCFLMYDIWGHATIVAILLYTIENITYISSITKFKNVHISLCHLPTILIIVKYILILAIPEWTIVDNPLQYLVHIMFGVVGLVEFIVFIFLFNTSSRQATILLRYLALGVLYIAIPVIITCIKLAIKKSFTLTTTDKISLLVSVSFLPLIVSSSILQYKSEEINRLIRNIIAFLGFASFTILIIQALSEKLSGDDFKHGISVLAILMPGTFYLLSHVINRFLTLETKSVKKDLEVFTNNINQTESYEDIFLISDSKIKSLLGNEYLIFFTNIDGTKWTISYSNTTKEIADEMFKQCEEKKDLKEINYFKNRSFVVNLFDNKRNTAKLFIGPKTNKDFYLPSEVSLIQRYLSIVYSRLLSFYSRTLTDEFKSLSIHSKYLDQEIDLAAFVQQSFYPQNFTKLPGWDIKYYWKPMAGVSGDLYDFFYSNNKLDGIGIFDVSGHGIASGLVTMLIKNIIHQEFYQNLDKPLDEVMHIIDQRFRKEKGNIENFLTGILIRIKEDSVEMVNAAHPYPILYSKKNDKVFMFNEIEKERSSIIGLTDFEPTFINTKIQMESGDEIILFTDGINEAINSERKQYGLNRLLKLSEKNIHLSCEEQKNLILEDLNSFVGNTPANDDITLLIVKKE